MTDETNEPLAPPPQVALRFSEMDKAIAHAAQVAGKFEAGEVVAYIDTDVPVSPFFEPALYDVGDFVQILYPDKRGRLKKTPPVKVIGHTRVTGEDRVSRVMLYAIDGDGRTTPRSIGRDGLHMVVPAT